MDQTAELTATPTEWVSFRSTSVNASVPVGTGLVLSSDVEPVTPTCSETEPDWGPLVTATASLAPVMTTETAWVDVVLPSLMLTS